jgi:hypothetical protein
MGHRMDKNRAEDVVELNTEETEQVVGGANGNAPATSGQPAPVELPHRHEEIIHRDGRIIVRRW